MWTHTLKHTHSEIRTHTTTTPHCMCTHAHTHTAIPSHTHTNTQTHTLSLSLSHTHTPRWISKVTLASMSLHKRLSQTCHEREKKHQKRSHSPSVGSGARAACWRYWRRSRGREGATVVAVALPVVLVRVHVTAACARRLLETGVVTKETTGRFPSRLNTENEKHAAEVLFRNCGIMEIRATILIVCIQISECWLP